MSRLSDLPNVGSVLEGLLGQAGITTPEELRAVGTKEAFIRVKLIDPTACIHMLYGIQGAVDGVKDVSLPESTKQELKAFFRSL